jgi:hypothetical protein
MCASIEPFTGEKERKWGREGQTPPQERGSKGDHDSDDLWPPAISQPRVSRLPWPSQPLQRLSFHCPFCYRK